jgi:glycosyltransferase involved in cell wall biosynthesis
MAPQPSANDPLVLHVRCVTGYGGGPEKTILNSPRFLVRLGYRTVCAFIHPPRDESIENLRQRAEAASAELLSVPDRGPWDLRSLHQLIRYCRQHRVAIWHAHEYKSNLFGLLARRFHKMKLVTTIHGWVQHTSRTPLYYAVDRKCLPRYDAVVAVSTDLQGEALRAGVEAERLHLVHNAIETEEFRRHAPSRRWSPNSDAPLVIGGMGRLSSEKGFDLLIRAVADARRAGLNCTLRIAGAGDQRGALEVLIDTLHAQSFVELLGQVRDVPSFFEGLDLFVLSSIREGLPNVVLEAMAMEVPVLATRVAGMPQLMASGVNGWLIEPGSSSAILEGIRAMAADAELRERLAAAGRHTVEQSFSFRQRMERIAAIYGGVLG